MRAPRNKFRIVTPPCRTCGHGEYTLSTHTTLSAAQKERERLYKWVMKPEPLHIQQWSVACGGWQRPDQCVTVTKKKH